MNRILLFVLCVYFCLFPLSTGNTAEGLKINGYDWETLSTLEKTYFLLGWVKCGDNALGKLPLQVNKWKESMEFYEFTQIQYKDEGILLSGVTIGQIEQTIDEIYSDSRVKTMDISEIMPLVSGRLIGGWTLTILDEVISIKSRLIQCQKEEKEKSQVLDECSSLRKRRNSYLKDVKRK